MFYKQYGLNYFNLGYLKGITYVHNYGCVMSLLGYIKNILGFIINLLKLGRVLPKPTRKTIPYLR